MDLTLETKIKLIIEGLDSLSKLTESITSAAGSLSDLGAQAMASGDPLTTMWQELAGTIGEIPAIDWSSFNIDSQLEGVAVEAKQASDALQDLAVTSQDMGAALNDAASGAEATVGSLGDFSGDAAQASSAAGGLATSAQDVSKAMEDVASGSEKAGKGIKDLRESSQSGDRAMEDLARRMDDITAKANLAVKAFISFAGVMGLKAAGDISARNETLGVTLDIIGKNAGYSTEQLKNYEDGLKRLGITTSAARNSLIQMLQSGLQVGPVTEGATAQINQLARAAQDLAVVSGENSSETLQRMITNIQQLDTMGLRWMGIVVELDKATEDYAKSIGKAAGALTSQERQQALLTATLEKAKGMQGAYEASMNTTGKQLQSMKRYQEELGSAIGDTLLPAYSELVKGATEFLKVSQQLAEAVRSDGTAAEALAAGVGGALDFVGGIAKEIVEAVQLIAPALADVQEAFVAAFAGFDGVGATEVIGDVIGVVADLTGFIAKMVAESAPAIRLLSEAFGFVVEAVGSTINELADLAGGMLSAGEAGSLLSTILESIGLLASGFADGLTIAKGAIQLMVGVALQGFGLIADTVGSLVGTLMPELGKQIEAVGDRALEMGRKAAQSGRDTFTKFEEGQTYVAKYVEALSKVPPAHEEEAKTLDKMSEATKAAYKKSEDSVLAFVKAVNEGRLRGEAANKQYAELSKAVKQSGEAYGFSEKQIVGLQSKLDTANVKASDLSESFKKLKLDATEFASGVSAAGSQAVQAFNELVNSGQFSADKLYNAFQTGLSMETTIGGLKNFSEAAQQAFKDGKLGATEFDSAIVLLSGKFDELFEKSLKAAKTQEDFDQLTLSVNKLAEAGAISGDRLAIAMQKISEAATGAREQMQRASEAALELAEAGLGITKAETAENKAAIEVERAKRDVVRETNENKQEGTALSKAELEAAEKALAAAEARLDVETAVIEQRKAEAELTEAASALKEAEAEFERTGSDEAYRAVEAGKERVAGLETALNATKQNVVEMETLAEETQQAADTAKDFAEGLKGADASKVREQLSMAGVTIAAYNWDSVVGKFQEMGYALEDAEKAAIKLIGRGEAVAAFGTRGMQEYNRITDAIREAEEALDAKAAKEQEVVDRADEIRQAYQDTVSAAEAAAQGLTGWSSQADAVAQAYQEIKLEALSAAQSASDAASGFVSAAQSIHEELLTAQGREEEVAQIRFESRRRELDVQYQQLQVQLEIARVQALAAGIDTSGLEQAAENSRQAYAQALDDLTALEQIDVQKRQEEAFRQAADIQNQLAGLKEQQVELDTADTSTMQERLDLLSQERDLRKQLSQLDVSVPSLDLSVQSTALDYSEQAQKQAAQQSPEFRAVDVSKIILEAAGKQAEVYTPVGQNQDVLAVLTELSKRNVK